MEDFLYSYNQPKQFGKYDLFLDGKITANEVVYKILTEKGEYQNIDIAEKVKEIESRLQTHFTFEHVDVLPAKGEPTVIYLVPNADTSDNPDTKDKYDEYMWDEEHQKFELIGSGSYAQQKAELDKEIADRKADVDAEEKRATAAEGTLDKKIEAETKRATEKEATIDAELANRVPYTLYEDVDVVGNTKNVIKLDVPELPNEAMYCPQGLIMGGSAQAAGLVTRGICGVSSPADDGSCDKENLYINYDGDNSYKNNRHLILQAGDSGVHYGYNLYQFAAARGDSVNYFINDKVKTERDRAQGIESNLLSRITSIENLKLSSVIELVNQLQSKITELEATVEELKSYHPVEEPTDPETPTESTE